MNSKVSIIKTNAVRIVEAKKIKYELHIYDTSKGFTSGVDVARQNGVDPSKVFKTLLIQGHSKEYYVCVIPVACELDLKKAAGHFGEKNTEMIHAKYITEVSGYIKGGCSPIGMKKTYKTVIHESAEKLETIYISGGKVGLQIQLNSLDLAELVQAKFEDLVVEKI